jgi:hypothetical protein
MSKIDLKDQYLYDTIEFHISPLRKEIIELRKRNGNFTSII